MIVRRNFRPWRVVPYVQVELLLGTAWAVLLWWLVQYQHRTMLILPFAPLGVLGTALAIFLGFRNNNSYSRWWEARTLWGSIVNNSRIVARLVIASANSSLAAGKGGGAEKIATFKREVIYRQIAFAHALRLHLRGQDQWSDLQPFLSSGEFDRITKAQNKPNLLLQMQAEHLKTAVREEMIGQFDPITLEPNLTALNNWQGGCERIKNTPVPRQYDFFTRVFLWLFYLLLPSAALGLLAPSQPRWIAVPLSVAIILVYALVNKVGQVNEDPFENRIQDVPLTALCNTIERDLKEQLGESDLPPRLAAVDGYLW